MKYNEPRVTVNENKHGWEEKLHLYFLHLADTLLLQWKQWQPGEPGTQHRNH